jgi:hypothetical protein
MKETEILSILENQISSAYGGDGSDLEDNQSQALDYYYGRPFGDEQDGQSQIVTRDVLETIEWIMPSMMRVFASGEEVVKFDPTGPEDEEQAQQETDYVNHIYSKDNDGFTITHDFIKGALLMKNAYVKVWAEKEEIVTTETYENLTDMGLAQVLEQDGAEAIEHEEEIAFVLDPATGMEVEQVSHKVKIEITTEQTKCRVAVVPQEQMGIAKGVNKLSLADSPFTYHRELKTVTELLEAGFDKETVEALPGYEGGDTGTLEVAREQLSTEQTSTTEPADASMREIEVYECYIRMDADDSGRAKLWKMIKAGNTLLDQEEADCVPFAALSPIMMPHQHIGLSEADLVMDIQRIRSVLIRQMLNNLYLTNNPEKEVLTKMVNMDDLMTSQAGGIKRVKQMGSIREISVPFTAGASMPMLQVLDQLKEGRTGVSRHTMGLDANVLAQSTKGAFMGAMEQANQRVEMLARTFAETGFKEMFRLIHRTALKHYDRKIVAQLRGKYVEVNPTEWKNRANMTVTVGLGTGNRDAELNQLFTIAEKQELHLMQGSPLVTPKNLYNTYARLVERSGLKSPGTYFTDPDSPEAQQAAQQKAQAQKQDPNEMMIQAQMKIEQDKAILQKQKQEQDAFFKRREQDMKERELVVREIEAGVKSQLEAAKIEQSRYEADLRAETAVAVESMKQGATIQQVLANHMTDLSVENDQRLTDMINSILGEINSINASNREGMEEMTEGMRSQVDGLAAQMARPKRVIYNEAGDPVGVESV